MLLGSWTSRFVAFFIVTFVGFSALYAVSLEWRVVIGNEDHVVENLTVLGFLLAFVAGAARFARFNREGRIAIALLALTGLVGVLDELSFGERIFGLKMPMAMVPGPEVSDFKIDGLHDFVDLGRRIAVGLTASYGVAVPLTLAVLLGVLVTLGWRHRRATGRWLTAIASTLGAEGWRLCQLFVAFLGVAVLIDLHLVDVDFYYLFFIEELLELNAAWALLMCILAIRPPEADPAAGTADDGDPATF